MTGPSGGNGGGSPTDELLLVHVRDAINPTLAGHGDVSYQSPPLPREDALALVRVLLGRGVEPDSATWWSCPIAGGRRTVTITDGS